MADTINDPEKPSDVIMEMMRSALSARSNAYCPYSHFRVGAAVLCQDGTIIQGINVENASYGLTMCAERVALTSAATQGHRKFKALAICGDMKDQFTAPCGACRQVIAEFGVNLPLYLVKEDMTWDMVPFTTLLPMAFTPESLKQERTV